MSLLALALSSVAILVTLLQMCQEKRINIANMQSDYYKKIYEQYLLKKIPEKLELIDFDENGRLDGNYKLLTDLLLTMIKDSGYFKFVNQRFYNDLRKKVTKLDDEMISIAGKKVMEVSRQEKYKKIIYKKVSAIMKLVNDYYTGTK